MYQRNIAEGLWTILSRASFVAKKNRDQFIEKGYNLKLILWVNPKVTTHHICNLPCSI